MADVSDPAIAEAYANVRKDGVPENWYVRSRLSFIV